MIAKLSRTHDTRIKVDRSGINVVFIFAQTPLIGEFILCNKRLSMPILCTKQLH